MNDDHINHIILELCSDEEDNLEYELLEQLKSILEANPYVVRETDAASSDWTLLHYAAQRRSVEFCKLLIEQNDAALMTPNIMGSLPFHISCIYKNIETAKYLFQMFPESIDIADSMGNYPIHCLLSFGEGKKMELTQFLIERNAGALTKSGARGCLPLHIACIFDELEVVKVIFNAYPEAIYEKNDDGKTPSQILLTSPLLDTQLRYIHLDEYENLPIHRGLQNGDILLGTIKLIHKANPERIRAADSQGRLPVHIACDSGQFDIVKFLIETDGDSIERYDTEGNCALHHSCIAGDCGIIDYILRQSKHGASIRNSYGKSPIQLLMYDANCNRDSLEYVGAIHCLLLAYPDVKDIALR